METTKLVQAAANGELREPAQSVWAQLIDSHLFHGQRRMRHELPLQIYMPEPEKFEGRIRAGTLGDLPYSHLAFDPHRLVCRNPPVLGTRKHMVVLQLAGASSFRVGELCVRLRPGEMLFFQEPPRMHVEHETRVEQVVLMNPLPTDLALQIGGRAGMLHHANRGPTQRMLSRWLGDAFVDGCWDGSAAGHDVAQMLSRLLGHVLCGNEPAEPPVAASIISRVSLEAYIARHLDDPELSVARIADAYACSVRTLHRAFAREGSESLERYLWQQRVLACARALRETAGAPTKLTDLALGYGFKSPTHFSSLFRKMFGVSPSVYRRHQLGDGDRPARQTGHDPQ